MASLRTIFFGPFVHCKSQQELDICEHGAVGVDEKGIIVFIERDVKDADPVAKKHGWVNPKVVRIYDSGFFFPGFIGTCIMVPLSQRILPGLFLRDPTS
jgi:guanine deaminase